jgi:hypothetical protein
MPIAISAAEAARERRWSRVALSGQESEAEPDDAPDHGFSE